MGATTILLLACAGPPRVVVLPKDAPKRPEIRTERVLDRDAAREWYTSLAAKTTKRARTPAEKAIPELVALHELLSSVEGLSATEKQRMKATLRGRIEWYGHRLRKQVADGERANRANAKGDNTAEGGASLAGAYSLIDLIQRTINPPIWDVNGGTSSIGYFAPYHALIVRAPGEVHSEIGGVLGQTGR